MCEALVAFLRTGSPSTSTLPWPAYTPSNRETLVFDTVSNVVSDLAGHLVRAAVLT
jgi:carboxylesterase type B